jgi:hypothetical protein
MARTRSRWRRDPGTGELDREPPLAAGEEGHNPINIFDAAARGAEEGLRIAATVGALLIAFISLIALLNIILGAGGDLVGLEGLTFQKLLGYAFAPVAFIVGVPWAEAVTAGSFLGEKLILNEFVASPTSAPGSRSSRTRPSPWSPSPSAASPTSAPSRSSGGLAQVAPSAAAASPASASAPCSRAPWPTSSTPPWPGCSSRPGRFLVCI